MSHWRAREEEGAENTVNLFTSSCSGSFLGPHFLFPCIDLQLANSSPSLLDPSASSCFSFGRLYVLRNFSIFKIKKK